MKNGSRIERVQTEKKILRRQGLDRRAGLDPAWRAEASAAITRRALGLAALRQARTVALFASFDDELDTVPLIHELIRQKGAVALPRVLTEPARRLEFRLVRAFPQDCTGGYRGILEPDPARCPEVVPPAHMDLIFVPGVLFDRSGARIGYGGGFYDRVLEEAAAARTVGLVFSPLLVEALPTNPWDRRVEALCTELELIETRSA